MDEAADFVPDLLGGLARITPDVAVLDGTNVLVRTDRREDHVAVISGGGAGHEPAHAGYVGAGMLSAAVSGEVFTSPSTDAVLAAIRAVAGRAGVLLVVKNYTGDRLNFGLAAQLARAEGIETEMVIVADDVALPDDADTAGRRGLAGTVLVHKVAGAAAAAGLSLPEVRAAAEQVIGGLGTMGVALAPGIVPAAGTAGFELGAAEIELGLGIHGEPGVRRGPIRPARELVEAMVERIAQDRGIGAGSEVAVLVNGLGGTPPSELLIVAARTLEALDARGIGVRRAWAGTFLSSLEMAGVSLSLVPVDPAVLDRLDAPTTAPAWPGGGRVQSAIPRRKLPAGTPGPPARPGDGRIDAAILAVCAGLEVAADRLTEMDRLVGDGDLGISLARGAAAVRHDLAGYDRQDPAATLRGMAGTVRSSMGGSSGALYAAALLAAADVLAVGGGWADAVTGGISAISAIGGAAPGDRTMLDALVPAAEALPDGIEAAAGAARTGAEATAGMTPRRGRSSYLGDRVRGHVDPGAEAVAVWLAALAEWWA